MKSKGASGPPSFVCAREGCHGRFHAKPSDVRRGRRFCSRECWNAEKAAPLAGYRNCSRCTAWRPVHEFPVGRKLADGRVQSSSWCEACHRRKARVYAARRYALVKADRTKVVRVDAGPLVAWLAESIITEGPWGPMRAPRLDVYGRDLLAEWAGTNDRTIHRLTSGEQASVDLNLVDRLLTWEGTTRLDDLYPLD